jgi:cell division protein FtsW (lipid II flippase)
MTKVLDKVALIGTALVLAALAWGMLHYSGMWFFPVALIVVFAALIAQNHRLKKRLQRREKLGDESAHV